MEIDVIILANTKTADFYKMTCNCIDSLLSCTQTHKFNIHLFESNKQSEWTYDYCNVTVHVPDEDFNFNRFYNLGLAATHNEYVLLINNDLLFEQDSIDKMVNALKSDEELYSVSPWEPTCHVGKHKNPQPLIYGHKVKWVLCGWALMVKRKVFDIIGLYDEDFKFWYQDNDYSENLKLHNIKHALVRDAVVVHLYERSHKTIKRGQSSEYKSKMKEVFDKKWKKEENKTKSLF